MLSLMARPFNEWAAYNMGLIDEKGKKIKDAKTDDEKDQFSRFMNIVRNIKRTVNKLSGSAETKLGNLLVGAALLREHVSESEPRVDPDNFPFMFLRELEPKYLKAGEISESIDRDEILQAGRYKLKSDFYENEPILYISEAMSPNYVGVPGIYIHDDVLGRSYIFAKEQLTGI